MKKIFLGALILFVLLSAFIFYKSTLYSLNESEKTLSFYQWYKKKKGIPEAEDKVYTYSIESPVLEIDRIYRSMQGPLTSKEFYLSQGFFSIISRVLRPELLWITGYKVQLFDENDKQLSDEFMCHNNINIGSKNVLPWYTLTKGTDQRLFTLTEGHTELHLPEGCGIPVLSNQCLRVDFQVLNHNLKDVSLKIRQRVTIYYKKESQARMKALYQQAAFVTKQISGPSGSYNEPVTPITASTQIKANPSEKPCCSRNLYDSISYNPFLDSYNRKYTGHWVIADSVEELKTDVTNMLGIVQDCRAHFFSTHVHPFCEQIEFIDETANQEIYKAEIINFSEKIGVKFIPFKSSTEGVPLYKNHRYSLKSRYNKKDDETHTAMATLFIYLEEPHE
jgi:hypothetical protein